MSIVRRVLNFAKFLVKKTVTVKFFDQKFDSTTVFFRNGKITDYKEAPTMF